MGEPVIKTFNPEDITIKFGGLNYCRIHGVTKHFKDNCLSCLDDDVATIKEHTALKPGDTFTLTRNGLRREFVVK